MARKFDIRVHWFGEPFPWNIEKKVDDELWFGGQDDQLRPRIQATYTGVCHTMDGNMGSKGTRWRAKNLRLNVYEALMDGVVRGGVLPSACRVCHLVMVAVLIIIWSTAALSY